MDCEPDPKGSSSTNGLSPEDLSNAELSLLEYLQEEAGVHLETEMPIATAFDSLRLTALVGALRKSGRAPQLTLRDALACDTVADLLRTITKLSTPAKRSDSKTNKEWKTTDPCFFKVREWPYMFSLSVCWALEADNVDVPAVQRALQSLLAKHGALSMKLADPLALWDLAMEAAANLSLARALLQAEFGRTKPLEGKKQRGRHRINRIMDFIGWLLWTAWPRLQHERNPEVNLDVIECEDSAQLELRSAWLLDGRNGREFLVNPIHAVLLTDAETGKCRLHIAVSHGLSDGFSGLPLLQDFIDFYGRDQLQQGLPLQDFKQSPFSGLLMQEARLKSALMVSKVAEKADISSWALPCSSSEAWRKSVWQLKNVSFPPG